MIYHKGDRIKLVKTTDEHTNLQPGDLGTVTMDTDRLGITSIKWDNGSTLGMIDGEDIIVKAKPREDHESTH